jgi:mono/diheme cytochrome c family protein
MKIPFRRILNLLLYLSFCVMVGTGLLIAYRLIPGSRGGQGLEVLGWSRHEWGALHTWVSYVFIALVAAHLAVNWTWLTKVAAKGHGWRLGAGLLAGAAIVGAFLLLPITQRQDRRGKNQGTSLHPSQASDFIRASSVSSEGPKFQRDIYPIFERSCVSCHGPEKQKAGFRADERGAFFQDDGKGPLVVPGKSGESRLVAIVTGAVKMKRNASDHVLPAQEVALIKSWIDAGAQ